MVIACYIDALFIALSNLINAGELLHIVFKHLTMASPLSPVKISCSQKMHMAFTYSSTGMALELTNYGKEGEGVLTILINFIDLVNE